MKLSKEQIAECRRLFPNVTSIMSDEDIQAQHDAVLTVVRGEAAGVAIDLGDSQPLVVSRYDRATGKFEPTEEVKKINSDN